LSITQSLGEKIVLQMALLVFNNLETKTTKLVTGGSNQEGAGTQVNGYR